jgi:hypothetical protein
MFSSLAVIALKYIGYGEYTMRTIDNTFWNIQECRLKNPQIICSGFILFAYNNVKPLVNLKSFIPKLYPVGTFMCVCVKYYCSQMFY